MNPTTLKIVCGDSDDRWCLWVDGKERWFKPVVAGDHDGYANEQPIVEVNGSRYRVGMCVATKVA